MSANANNVNQSVGKALQIIDVMSQNATPMRLLDISKELGMPSSTALRMIGTLVEYGYVAQDRETLKYFLTLKFAKIGAYVASHFDLYDASHSELMALSEKCNEAACIAIESNHEAVYTDIAEGSNSVLRITQFIGKRACMHSTGVGKCLLLNYSAAQIDALIDHVGLPRFTPSTITTKNALIAELAKIRDRGFAYDEQECELGVRCVAAPILNYTGRVIAAISVSGPVNRMSHEYMDAISVTVISTAQTISEALSFS